MKALVIVDMQNDFMPGGALGVPKADELVPMINKLIPEFPLVVATLDWHPKDHVSFASNHKGKKAGDHVKIGKMEQILWPVHCVQNTQGAEIVQTLQMGHVASIFYKGSGKDIDSYSAFYDNARQKSTGLGEYLRVRGMREVYLVGVATEYCVLYSAFDAVDLGFAVYVIADACRAINLDPKDEEHALQAMAAKGVKVIQAKDV